MSHTRDWDNWSFRFNSGTGPCFGSVTGRTRPLVRLLERVTTRVETPGFVGL